MRSTGAMILFGFSSRYLRLSLRSGQGRSCQVSKATMSLRAATASCCRIFVPSCMKLKIGSRPQLFRDALHTYCGEQHCSPFGAYGSQWEMHGVVTVGTACCLSRY